MDPDEPESARLDREIAALLQKKAAAQAKEQQRAKVENARRANILVENSPVKKKTPAQYHAALYEQAPIKQPIFNHNRLTNPRPQAGPSKSISRSHAQPPALSSGPSRLSSALHRARQDDTPGNPHADGDDDISGRSSKKRDEVDMTVIESLTMGPKDYGMDSLGSDEWRWTEPNSGINLKERLMPHAQVQNHLADRYILSPSQIYSIMRLSSDKQRYTLPVDAGWAVIGVVCHKGEIKVTQGKRKEDKKKKGKGRASDEGGDEDDDEEDEDEDETDGKRQKNGQGPGEWTKKKKTGKNAPASKFITIKICSLPSRSQLSGSTSASQGDAIMNVMLFESDSDETLPPSYPGEPLKRRYRGGSGGAFEVWWKLAVGAVVGIVSPRILKPFGAGNKGPHPLTHPVGLTPSSADDIFLIGRARDLGTCASIKRDGKQCTEWVDLRVHQHCEYHVVGAIKQIRGGRAEFAGSTGGFQLAMKAAAPMYRRGKGGQDDGREWKTRPTNQILPKRGFDDGTGQTYIVGGRAISERKSSRFADEHVVERIGREKQTNLRRKNEAAAREKELDMLMGSNNGTTGAKYLEAANKLRRDDQKDKKELQKKAVEQGLGDTLKPRPFHASAIKLIGFDPTTAQNDGGLMVEKGEEGRKRLEAIASLRSNARPAARLGNMAGMKSKSNASNPLDRHRQVPTHTASTEEPMIDLTDSDDD